MTKKYQWKIEVRHEGLNKYRVIQGTDKYIVEQKARVQQAQWEEQWQRKLEADRKRQEREDDIAQRRSTREQKAQYLAEQEQLALERTQTAQASLTILENILAYALGVDITVSWESLKDHSEFTIAPPQPFAPLPPIPPEPQRSDEEYHVELNLVDMVFASRRVKKEQAAETHFQTDHQNWLEAKARYEELTKAQTKAHQAAILVWEQEREAYLKTQVESNAAIDAQKTAYLAKEPDAIREYCDLVLSNSQYPDYFPQSYELDYNPQNGILVVDYQLPAITDLSTLQEVRYIKSRDEFSEKHISQAQLNRTYDSLLYQIVLRTIYELYQADQINVLTAIAFNGYVSTVAPATGQEVTPCILTIQANRTEFEQIRLANIEPQVCFKSLKGISSTKLHSLAPIAPLMQINRADARFTLGRAVMNQIEEGHNLAVMDWADFEHFIRELFEKEFSTDGSEVRVTRASRDGGVDAVVFDPDPIRGGKIVIQAKRYINTVGVSFVRDLYGTVLNEGATKGILVSTSSYGPDAYEFAKGKPLVLIDGNNLLYLLEKHGYKARIDLNEAKRLMTER